MFDEDVVVGNAGVLRCRIPSFVADLVTVNSWQDGDGRTYFPASSHGKWRSCYSGGAGVFGQRQPRLRGGRQRGGAALRAAQSRG